MEPKTTSTSSARNHNQQDDSVTIPRIISSLTDSYSPHHPSTSSILYREQQQQQGDQQPDLEQELISEDLTVNSYEDYKSSNELTSEELNSNSGLSNSLDSKDKRRHYLMKNKDIQLGKLFLSLSISI